MEPIKYWKLSVVNSFGKLFNYYYIKKYIILSHQLQKMDRILISNRKTKQIYADFWSWNKLLWNNLSMKTFLN